MTTHDPALIAEAALCIWECMLEQRPDNADRAAAPAVEQWRLDMGVQWRAHGTVEMRRHAYRLGTVAQGVFEALGLDWMEEHDLIPFDWEFIPAVVARVDWSSLYEADNRPERIADEIRRSAKRREVTA